MKVKYRQKNDELFNENEKKSNDEIFIGDKSNKRIPKSIGENFI